MYFPQGHEAYLRTFPENKTPPYKLFKGRPAVVRCQVRACVRACVLPLIYLFWTTVEQ